MLVDILAELSFLRSKITLCLFEYSSKPATSQVVTATTVPSIYMQLVAAER
jgi:hypothetical protein